MENGFSGMTLKEAEMELGILTNDLEYFTEGYAQTENSIAELNQYIYSLQAKRSRRAKTARNTKRNRRSTR